MANLTANKFNKALSNVINCSNKYPEFPGLYGTAVLDSDANKRSGIASNTYREFLLKFVIQEAVKIANFDLKDFIPKLPELIVNCKTIREAVPLIKKDFKRREMESRMFKKYENLNNTAFLQWGYTQFINDVCKYYAYRTGHNIYVAGIFSNRYVKTKFPNELVAAFNMCREFIPFLNDFGFRPVGKHIIGHESVEVYSLDSRTKKFNLPAVYQNELELTDSKLEDMRSKKNEILAIRDEAIAKYDKLVKDIDVMLERKVTLKNIIRLSEKL